MTAIIELGALVTVESVTISGPLIGSLSAPAAGALLLVVLIGICTFYAMGVFSLSEIKTLFEGMEFESAA